MKKIFVAMSLALSIACATSVFAQVGTNNPVSAPASAGMKIIDPTRGVEFTAPNAQWDVNANKYTLSLNHNTYYDTMVSLKKGWYTVATAQEAYDKRKEGLKSYLPGAIFLKENEAVMLSGTIPGISMTYKNPSDLKIFREIMFVYRGQAYELVFQSKEENFQQIKNDFGFILQNMKLN